MLIAASSQKSSPPGRNARSLCTLLATSLVGAALLMPAPAFAEMRGGHSGGGHGGYRGGGGMMGVGTGLAIGGIIGTVIQQSAQRPPDVVQSQPRRSSGKDSAKTRTKKKDVAKAKPVPVKQDAQHPANCEQCKPLAESIAKYETMLAEEKARLAAEEREKKRHEAQLARFNRAFDDPMRKAWTEAIAGNTARIADIQALIAQIEAVLKSRKDQLAAHTKPSEVASKPKDKEEQVASVPPLVPVIPAVGVPTSPGMSTPPSVSTPPSTPPSTPSQSGPPTTSPPTGTTTTTTTATGTPTATPTGLTSSTPPPAGSSNSSMSTVKGPCDDHIAEVTNGKRIFHRLYVNGEPKNDGEKQNWKTWTAGLQSTLEGQGRQAAGSTTKTLTEPTMDEFKQELARIKQDIDKARKEAKDPKDMKLCPEVTIFLSGHGAGGFEYGVTKPELKSPNEVKGEVFVMRNKEQKTASGADDDALLFDKDMGPIVKEFGPDVSVTTILSVCYGGGFAAERDAEGKITKGNIEEGRLVSVIGLYNLCPNNGTFESALRDGIDGAAAKASDARVTANDLKGHLTRNNWPIGVPFDTATDKEVRNLRPR